MPQHPRTSQHRPWLITIVAVAVSLVSTTPVLPFASPASARAVTDYTYGGYWAYDGPDDEPFVLAVGSAGQVYASGGDGSVRTFSADGTLIATWAIPAVPSGMDLDAQGNLHIGDGGIGSSSDPLVRVYSPVGALLRTYAIPETYRDAMNDLAIAPDGTIAWTDYLSDSIHRFTSEGTYLGEIGGPGVGLGQFEFPADVAYGADGTMFVADFDNHRVQALSPQGVWRSFGQIGAGPGQLQYPHALEIGPDGHVFVGDYHGRIQEFTPEGVFVQEIGADRIAGSVGKIAFAATGTMYAAATAISDTTTLTFGSGIHRFVPASAATPTPPPPSAQTQAQASIRGQRLDANRKRTSATLVVACSMGVGTCTGRIKVHTARGKAQILGRASFTSTPGADDKVRVTLNRRARSQLRQRGKVKVVVVLAPQGGPRTTKRALLIR